MGFGVAAVIDLAAGVGAAFLIFYLLPRFAGTRILLPVLIIWASAVSYGLAGFAVHAAAAAGDPELAAQFYRASNIGSVFTIPAFFHLVTLFPRPLKAKWVPMAVNLAYVDAFALMMLSPTRFVIENIAFDGDGHPIPQFSPVRNLLQLPFILLLIGITTWLLYLAWKSPHQVERHGARGLLLAAGLPSVAYAIVTAAGVSVAPNDWFDVVGLLYLYFVIGSAFVLTTGRLQPPAPSTLGVLLQSVREGVVIVDGSGAVAEVNPATCSLLRRREDELLGLPIQEFARLCVSNPDMAATFATAVRGVQRGRMDSNEQKLELSAGGRKMAVDIRPLGERNARGEAPAVMMVWLDETERLAYAELLRRSNELQDLVIRVLGHDLKAPLAIVQGFVELSRERLGRSPTKADLTKVRKDLGKISEVVASMLVLMANARALSRLTSSGESAPQMEDTDVARMVQEAVDLFSPSAKTRELRLEAEIEDGLRARVIPGFESVPKNLIDNAVKYTPSGGQVDVRLERRDGSVWLTVEDNGPGIPMDKRDLVFRKFERLGAEKGATEGHGLGLSITAKLVELSGGKIAVGDRADGKRGTRFVVELPRGDLPMAGASPKANT